MTESCNITNTGNHLKGCGLSCLLICWLVVTVTYHVQASSTNRVRFVNKRAASRYQLTVNLRYSSHSIENTFLGVCMEPSALWRFCDPAWVERAKIIAKHLSPCELRMGGTSSHYVTFEMERTECQKSKQKRHLRLRRAGPILGYDIFKPITITGKLWEILHSFLRDVGWDLLFDFNLFKLNASSQLWDPSEAERVLKFSASRDIQLPLFQLGNEPNSYPYNFNYSVAPQNMVKSYQILKNLIAQYPKYKSSKLYGPDVTNLDVRRSPVQYLQGFLEAGAQNVIDEVSIHHYYCGGKTATNTTFLDENILDSLKNVFKIGFDIINRLTNPPLKLRMTETSSCFGGGAPGLSNRYIAGFLWLDKLGVSAMSGITRVFRQAFLGASYSLASVDMTTVYPDYFLSVLFKQLVKGPVFNISVEPANPKLRVYANCARDHLYKAGAVIVYFLNIGSQDVTLSLTQFPNHNLDLFMLTPGEDEGLTSSKIKLNGQVLGLNGSQPLSFSPKPHRGDITVLATSFGFAGVPLAAVERCQTYYKKKSHSPTSPSGTRTNTSPQKAQKPITKIKINDISSSTLSSFSSSLSSANSSSTTTNTPSLATTDNKMGNTGALSERIKSLPIVVSFSMVTFFCIKILTS